MQADPGVPVLVVVVGEEDAAELAGFTEGGEAAGERRAVLEGLEVRFGVRVVVRDVRPGGDFVIFRSVSRSATVLEVIEVPLSAWMQPGRAAHWR